MRGGQLHTICRLCLAEKIELFDVFTLTRIPGWTAADAILELLLLQVSKGDIYPQCVCIECMGKLEDFKIFKQQCESNKDLLDRAYAGKNAVGRDEDSINSYRGNQSGLLLSEDAADVAMEEDPLDLTETKSRIKIEVEESSIEPDPTSPTEGIESANQIFLPIKREFEEHGTAVETDLPHDSSTEPMKLREEHPEVDAPCGSIAVDSISSFKEEVLDIPTESHLDDSTENENALPNVSAKGLKLREGIRELNETYGNCVKEEAGSDISAGSDSDGHFNDGPPHDYTIFELKNDKIIRKRKWGSSDGEGDFINIEPRVDIVEGEGGINVAVIAEKGNEDEKTKRGKGLGKGKKGSQRSARDSLNALSEEERIAHNRELARIRAKRTRERKKMEMLSMNPIVHTEEYRIARKRELARQRSRKYREKNKLKSIPNDVLDSQTTGSTQDPDEQGSSGCEQGLSGREKGLSGESTVCVSQIAGPSMMTVSNVCEDSNSTSICNFSASDSTITHQETSLPCENDSPTEQSDSQFSKGSFPFQALLSKTPRSVPHSQTPEINIYRSYVKQIAAIREFHKQFVDNSFGHACSVCDRLCFRSDLKGLDNSDNINMEIVEQIIPNTDVRLVKICASCRLWIRKDKIPLLSTYNGFKYPEAPDFAKLYPLDLVSERLVCPRIPFKQISRLRHVNGQFGIYGQVINIPLEVNTMVKTLPRVADDKHCVYVHIKQKRFHKSSVVRGLVERRAIEEWLKYLVDTPLYKAYGIAVDSLCLERAFEETSDVEVMDDLSEEIPTEECLVALQHSLMWNDDAYVQLAQGETNVRACLLFDEHAEELSFPSIYYGQSRTFREDVHVTPFMMAKSELRRADRRGVTPQHLLYMAIKVMRLRVRDYLSLSFKNAEGTKITKEDVQCDEFVRGFIVTNLGFLRTVPNSIWYWCERKRELIAMIRQYGKPTVSFTIDSNEIGWADLLKLLYRLKNGTEISEEALAQMPHLQKSILINEDVVTCAIYFNKLVNVIMNILQSRKWSPFGRFRIQHYFKRIEFQHDGSTRAHVLAWLDNAPLDAVRDDYDKTVELIDSLISVSESESSGNIKLQTHDHTFDCCRKITSGKVRECRFDAPFMPCKKTMILTPMKNTEERFEGYRERYQRIRTNLENVDYEGMGDFYSKNGIRDDGEYINIIRAGIETPKVFVKRDPSEKWRIAFNPFLLHAAKSRIDFQFITEEHSCAGFVHEYVDKTDRGVSNLQRKIIEIMDQHPEFDMVDITRSLSVDVMNHSEMTIQEAAWYLLREPVSKASVSIVYIPTVWPTERTRMKKSAQQTSSEVDEESTDLLVEKWFDKYVKRPENLGGETLAQFVSKYKSNRKGEYVERTDPIVIRYRNYNAHDDVIEYKREMVTLHVPFRCEEEEILEDMKFVSIYDDNQDVILQRRKEFESEFDVEETMRICRELCLRETSEGGIKDVVRRFPIENWLE